MVGPEGPISLLLLTDTAVAGQGGSERFLRNLVGGLPASRYRIDVMQLCSPLQQAAQAATLADLPHVRYLHHPLEAVYGRAGWSVWWWLCRQVWAGRYDIVQSQHEKSDLISALLPMGLRGAARISNRRDMGFQKSARLKLAFRHLNARFDRLVAPTPAILEGLRKDEAAPAERLLCLPNGVDTQRFAPPSAEQRRLLRAALGYDERHLVIGCVASLTPVKCHHDLLLAFEQVRRELPWARLLLIGEGPLRGAIELQVQQAGLADCVRLMGVCQDVSQCLPALDVLALASSTEGLSNAVLEALSCGIPAVVTAVGGNPDLVTQGQNGLLVPPCQVQALAAALLQALRDPGWRAAAGQCARETVLAGWSIGAMVAGYERLYQSLLACRPLRTGQVTPRADL